MFPHQGVFTTLRVSWLIALLCFLCALPAGAAISESDALHSLELTQAGFQAVHARVAPAVVSITSQITEDTQSSGGFYDFFFGQPPQTQRRRVQATGSGFIISKDGLILTNSHVVENATKVQVQLSGSDKKLAAEVVQTDTRSDLAVVRITEKGEHNFPTVAMGDAKNVKVGDWAIAFGSPFHLATTMTVGVISAVGRELPSPDDQNRFSDLLQTDASINPGNSGGPLCNIQGEVIGINFMIYSPGSSAGSVGIGFAIPINDYTKDIIQKLEGGHPIVRGRLGIAVRNLDDAMRDHYGVSKEQGGILVDSVLPGQAAEKGGMKDEDIIVEYHGTKIVDVDQFIQLVERTAPGTKVTVVIVRNKKEMELTLTVGEAPNDAQRASVDQSKAGMTVATLTPEIAAQNHLSVTKGVVITQVEQGGPADDIGLQPGDVILRVGDDQVQTADDFWVALSKQMAVEKHGVLLRVQRGNMATDVTMPIIEDLSKKDNK